MNKRLTPEQLEPYRKLAPEWGDVSLLLEHIDTIEAELAAYQRSVESQAGWIGIQAALKVELAEEKLLSDNLDEECDRLEAKLDEAKAEIARLAQECVAYRAQLECRLR